MKRFIAAILIALLALMLTCATALAAPAKVYVAGTDVTAGGYWASGGAGGITAATEQSYTVYYDGAGTLFLRGAQITKSHGLLQLGAGTCHCGIFANGDLAIVLEGDSSIILPDSFDESSYCIYVYGNLSIESAAASLTVKSGDGIRSIGVYAGGDITLTGGELSAQAGACTFSEGVSAGLCSQDGSILLKSGTVAANGAQSANFSYGACAEYNVSASGGALTASGGAGVKQSCGVYAKYGDILISGGIVTAEGGASTGEYGGSFGALASNRAVVSGGALYSKSGEATMLSFGVNGFNGVYVTGGELNAEGATATDAQNGESCGAYSMFGEVAFTGGRITAKGGAAAVSGAVNKQPAFNSAEQPDALWYKWRVTLSGEFSQSTVQPYVYEGACTYLQIAPRDRGGLITYTYEDWLRDNQYDQMAPPSGLKADTASPDVEQVAAGSGLDPTAAPVPAAPVTADASTPPPPQTGDSANALGFVMLAAAVFALIVFYNRHINFVIIGGNKPHGGRNKKPDGR